MTRPTTPQEPLTCNDVSERLIGGERPASDPALNEHVGSCLSCLRTASDLRGLPTLRRQLQESQGELPDPGAAFWASFPAQVAEASNIWQGRDAVASATPKERWHAWVARMAAWIRMPVPAACTGALAAVTVVLFVMRLGPTGESDLNARRESASAANALGAANDVRISSREPTAAGDETLPELDVSSLRKLQAEMEQTLAGVPARATSESEESISTDPAGLSEDLDELNEAGLAVLAENLEESI